MDKETSEGCESGKPENGPDNNITEELVNNKNATTDKKSTVAEVLFVEVISDESDHGNGSLGQMPLCSPASQDPEEVFRRLDELLFENKLQSDSEVSDLQKSKFPFGTSSEGSPRNGQDEIDIIELESLSSHNRNTRLKSNTESSSEFIVSSSSKNTPNRPRLNTTMPSDSFERYLENLSKKYKEMTHRDRVLLWNFSSEVNEVEDYIEFEENLLKNKQTPHCSKRRQTRSHLNNNNNPSTCTTKTLCNSSPSKDLMAINCATHPEIISKTDHDNVMTITCTPRPKPNKQAEDGITNEKILMSINTKTMQIYKIDPNLCKNNDNNKQQSSDVTLMWPRDDSVFKRNRLNPEIDKIRATKRKKITKRKSASDDDDGGGGGGEVGHGEDDHDTELFKIPHVPRKYSLKMDSSQKEEFYKYLGLGTRSPNGKCDDENDALNKRRSLRVKRLRDQKNVSPKLDADDASSNHNGLMDDDGLLENRDRSSNSEKSSTKSRSISPPPKSMEPKIKIIHRADTSPTTLDTKQKRSCGSILQSSLFLTPTKDEISNSDNSHAEVEKDELDCKLSPLSSSLIQERHCYKGSKEFEEKKAKSSIKSTSIIKNICNDSSPNKNGIIQRNDEPITRNNTITYEKQFNERAKEVYEKLQNFLKERPSSNIRIVSKAAYEARVIKSDVKKDININEADISKNEQAQSPALSEHSFTDGEKLDTAIPPDLTNIGDSKLCTSIKKPPMKKLDKIRKRNRKLFAKSGTIKILRSMTRNAKFLRSRKLVTIIASKTRSKRSRDVKSRRNSNSDKSSNLLSPARVATRDKEDENLIVKIPEIRIKKLEISQEIINNSVMEEKPEEPEPVSATKVDFAQTNFLPNPLNHEKGKVLHIFFAHDLLVVIQEFHVSCYKYVKVIKMLGKSQEWELMGECKRVLNDVEISSPYRNRLCVNNTNPIYVEMRARQFPEDPARECNKASVYVNVYYFNEWKASVVAHSVQLDTIRGLAFDVTYTTITNSRYFVMCWRQEGIIGSTRTGLCKYALTPDLDTLASIREFKHMRHLIHRLECINEDKLIGFGVSQVTIWDHRTGDVLINFDLTTPLGENVGSILSSVEFKDYLFLYQIHHGENTEIPELKILAITLSQNTPSFRVVYTHELPLQFTSIKSSLSCEDFVIATSNSGEEFLLIPYQHSRLYYSTSDHPKDLNSFHTSGSRCFVEITSNTLIVKTSHEYLLNFMR